MTHFLYFIRQKLPNSDFFLQLGLLHYQIICKLLIPSPFTLVPELMLLIWDIHINTRYQEKILTELRTVFSTYPDEKTIVFFWDYVYHFAYDRNALLQLYKLFLELFGQGKQVYILAGNHDRLGNSFVFEEAQKAFDILLKNANVEKWKGWKIKFVTKPIIENIEGEDILFMPFFLSDLPAMEGDQEVSNYTPKNERLKSISDFSTLLEKSTHKHEVFSWHINKFLAEQIDKNTNLTVFHHYYINGTTFPGQRSKFNYKDIALNEQFLDMPNIKFISGHLHQPFTHNNYLCLWSVRSTSSLETNQNKYVFHYDTGSKKITAIPLMINPQVTIRSNETINEAMLREELQKINELNKSYFSSPARDIMFKEDSTPNLTNISLTLNVEHIDYDKLDDLIDPDLRTACKDIRLKKDIENVDNLLNTFKVSSDDLNGFSDRKNILQSYMQQKFGNDYAKYEKVLKELKLL